MHREDRRVLDEIEQRLTADAPDLAAQLAQGRVDPRPPSWGVGSWVWSGMALALVVVSVVLGEVFAAVQAAACAGALIGLRQWEISAE